jgi:hypothetical protein
MDEMEWIRQAILKAYPNPEHIGCPDPETLKGMARRTLPMVAAEQDHVFHCSPCFATYISVRNEIRRSRLIRLSTVWSVAAALVAALSYYAFSSHYTWRAPQRFATAFNLQERPVFRGINPATIHPSPFVLPRGIIHLSLTLPLGSEPGTYQLQICRNGRTDPLVTVSGSAVLQPNGSTVLTVELNSTRLSTGPYALGVRMDDAEWSYSPLLVRDPTGG